MEEAVVMIKLLEFCVVVGAVMSFGYMCGLVTFRLQEKYYGKKDDESRG